LNIYLLRHGMTQGNLERRYIGRTDEPLCEQGRLLAQGLGVRLEKSGVQEVWTSPLLRCRETASLAFPGQDQRIENDFRECDFGEFEYKNYEELKENPRYQRWLSSGGTLPFPGGESREDFCARCRRAFSRAVETLQTRGIERAAFVVHGGTIMAILSGFGQPRQDYYHWQVENCGGYLVELGRGGLVAEGCRIVEKIGEERPW
jgi:alpha-ribazole phosphatase